MHGEEVVETAESRRPQIMKFPLQYFRVIEEDGFGRFCTLQTCKINFLTFPVLVVYFRNKSLNLLLREFVVMRTSTQIWLMPLQLGVPLSQYCITPLVDISKGVTSKAF